jgi:hypothetical protein
MDGSDLQDGPNCEDFPQSLQNLTRTHGFRNDNSVTPVVVFLCDNTFQPVGLSGLRGSSSDFAHMLGGGFPLAKRHHLSSLRAASGRRQQGPIPLAGRRGSPPTPTYSDEAKRCRKSSPIRRLRPLQKSSNYAILLPIVMMTLRIAGRTPEPCPNPESPSRTAEMKSEIPREDTSTRSAHRNARRLCASPFC